MLSSVVVNDITYEVCHGMARNTMVTSVSGANFCEEVAGHSSSVKEKTVGRFVLTTIL